MKYGVFIQSNKRQHVGALVSAYSIRRGTKNPKDFTITIMDAENPLYADYLKQSEGKTFLRDGKELTWRNDVLQSFPPLRFAPPELMSFEGRAIVIDPDVFAFGDVLELFKADMMGKALLTRKRLDEGTHFTSSVMLLDCAKLKHWRFKEMFQRLLDKKTDWQRWMRLEDEPKENVGFFEPEWNDFDNLTQKTRLLHNTKQQTQPWRTGLLIDPKARDESLIGKIIGRIGRIFKPTKEKYHKRHPDPAQEMAFFALLKEGMERGEIPRDVVEKAVKDGNIRPDALAMVAAAPTLPANSRDIASSFYPLRKAA